ncbi:hypothetical protein GHN41_15485 [Pseudomonas helleri]|uniref:Mor transcription activator domain-containing protein n=2 Tax=Pseudomonas TaxID=286 RepID=A0A6G1W4T2_9PSED|nr:Mor transcription activator family protein [Pseudomonas helleri]MQT26055.1 hypothetical protein [Pseudomonas helleri]MQU17840.1 hypothetical protein [Pseudomonas helleri]
MRPNEFAQERKGSTVKGAEVAASMAAHVSHRLRERGIAEQLADTIALEVLVDVQRSFGGLLLYFALGRKAKASAIHEELYDEYLANNLTIAELAKKYDHSLQWAYKVIGMVRISRRKAKETERSVAHQRDVERWKREGGAGDGA